MKKTLYKIDTGDRMRIWMIWIEKMSDQQFDIVTSDGIEDGKFKGSRKPIFKGKGGKTIEQQAISDAESIFRKKMKDGGVEDRSQAKHKGETATIDAPAKGFEYHPNGRNDAYTLNDLGWRGKPIGLQLKLDGYRYRIKVNETDIIYYSSGGDIVPEFPHISKAIRSKYDLFVAETGLTEFILDGEIYDHAIRLKYGFNIIQKACGTRKHLTPDKIELRSKLQFYLFDIVLPDKSYLERENRIRLFFDEIDIKSVETYHIIADEKTIEKYFDAFVLRGFEGVILRDLNALYEHKKSKQFMKYKPKIDEEFLVIDLEEEKTGGTLGGFVCRLLDGRTFTAQPKDDLGSDEMKKHLWDTKIEHIGKWITVEFGEYSIDGIPRWPKAKAFRNGPSID